MQKLYITLLISTILLLTYIFIDKVSNLQQKSFLKQNKKPFSCKNSNFEDVDWFVILKMPEEFKKGKSFVYLDSKLSKFDYRYDFTNLQSPLMKTLRQITDNNSQEYASVFWNDQPLEGSVSSEYAISKGIIGVDEESGFIINHSVPEFPVFKGDKVEQKFDDSQLTYGEHFFCMSASTSAINNYAQGLQLNNVFTLEQSSVPETLSSQLNYLQDLLLNEQQEGTYSENSFETLGSQQIIQFSKSGLWEESFYNKVVSPSYKLDFIFETSGKPLSKPDCEEQYTVVSNKSVQISDKIIYPYTNDHSKYGISTTSDVVCFGDLDRQTSQNSRGGGTNCFHNELISDFLKTAFVEQQKC